ncbi:hypothetical protein E1212_07980 [Jiangella ureilytica]|uniref:Cupin domain-containing protein n=1 Tax=Jiangella ureilytica TaxID=2530374 RepID=A0A4R4RRZ9_9ACTN|nr:hypothetical protein [Jiangella ureilytica]TDC52781.1 hypothetical protein E1212_07980 [Jiangella ureilytica]
MSAPIRFTAPDDGRLIGLYVPASFDAFDSYYPNDGRRAYLTEFDLPLQIVRTQGSPGDAGSKHVHLPQEPSRGWPTCHKVMVCLSGAVRVEVSDFDGVAAGTAELRPGDALLCVEGHEAVYLEDGSRLLEIRQGPYPGNVSDDRIILA